MRNWLVLTLVVAAAAGSATSLQGREPPKSKQYQIDLAVKRGDPLGSREKGTLKILSEPRLITLENKPATFTSGGEVAVGGDFIPYGLSCTFKLEKAASGKINLNLVLERTEVIENSEDRVRLKSEKTIQNLTVQLGAVSKIRWVDPKVSLSGWKLPFMKSSRFPAIIPRFPGEPAASATGATPSSSR